DYYCVTWHNSASGLF
nr:immunoglobulin light chain junction region [Macaca mulatta]